jgi:hypothetical protein
MDLAALGAQEEAKENGIGQSLLRSLRTAPRGESGGAGLRRTKPKNPSFISDRVFPAKMFERARDDGEYTRSRAP